jgi:hypothetical protein
MPVFKGKSLQTIKARQFQRKQFFLQQRNDLAFIVSDVRFVALKTGLAAVTTFAIEIKFAKTIF